MFDKSLLQDVLVAYKEDFSTTGWDKEKYKWQAVKCFQDNWDVNAADFADMLQRSLEKTENLLASRSFFPRSKLEKFAVAAPMEVRAMFINLFDEHVDVYERIKQFKDESAIMLEKYGDGELKHDQNENAISTYLWLRYPDKYYIYKYSEVRVVVKELGSDHQIKKGAYANNIRIFLKLYDEICDELKQDRELVELLQSRLTDDCYPDPQLKTLTIDVGFYISRYYSTHDQEALLLREEEWFPADYDPGLSVEDWLKLINDKSVFLPHHLEIMRRLKDYGGQATPTQLAIKYGNNKNFYVGGSVGLARRIVKKTGCPIMKRDEGGNRWWSVLYVGKYADQDAEGVYIWRLRPELAQALDQVDLSHVPLYGSSKGDDREPHYWWLNANPAYWSLSDLAVDEVWPYTLYSERNHKRPKFQNFLDAREGDIVIGYESTPVKQIVAILEVAEEQDGDDIYFRKIENLASPINYRELKSSPELKQMEFHMSSKGSLFKLTEDEFDFIMDLIREENPQYTEQIVPSYTKDDFLEEVYMSEARYDRLSTVLHKKQNIILQGAPGVGKTFAAKRLAYAMLGQKDDHRIEFVQFHQNYSYEDFVMGYKPVEDGFELQYGIFFRFCQKAASRPDKEFFFIIDEINRGNMSKIFGELLMLIEKDYRGHKITLAYNGMQFAVPANLYIIGMMNTADRSLAMIDYALRRRFSFVEMEPGFDSAGFIEYQRRFNDETFDELLVKVQDLNRRIAADNSLGSGFQIGHSYFCELDDCSEESLRAIIDFDILPMLSEYWFDDAAELQRWTNTLHGVFQ